MGTLYTSHVYSTDYDTRVQSVLERFGWHQNTTPDQLQAAIAYVAEARQQYLVDRHDELAAGLGEELSLLREAILEAAGG